jgi:hypothetical protein
MLILLRYVPSHPSLIYKLTDISLQSKCNDLVAKQIAAHPGLAALEDGQSTAAGSANGTPRASVAPAGGTKLRLTMGGGGAINGGGASGDSSAN